MEPELEEFILELTEKFEQVIPKEDEDFEKLKTSFKKDLEESVQMIKESDSEFARKDVKSIKSILNRMANRYFEANIESIKYTLLEDEAFEEVKNISLKIFELAQKKAKGEDIEVNQDLDEEIEKIKQLLSEVKDYNKEEAKKLLSEAIVDKKFIRTKNADVMSLRLADFLEYQSREER